MEKSGRLWFLISLKPIIYLKYELPFTLFADEEKEVIKAFGVWGPKKFQGREYEGIHRITFIIDDKGVVEQVIGKVKTKDHAAQILACL